MESRRELYSMYAIIVLACALGNLSQTAVSAMLPHIDASLGIDVTTGQWLTSGYMLALGIVVPLATYCSHRFSWRMHICIGLMLSIIGSLLDIFAQDFVVMLLGRILQAASCGVLMPLMQTIAMTEFAPGKRATAMGIAGIAMGFAPNVGPTVGGAMNHAWGWQSFFVLLLGFSAVLMIATVLFIPGGQAKRKASFETSSFIFSTLGFGGILLGLSQASSLGFASFMVWVPILLGTLFLLLFFWRQKRVASPLIDLSIFHSSRYNKGIVALSLLFASFMGVTLVIPLYVVDLCHGTSLDAGLVILPTTISALVMNPLSGILADRFGTRPVVLVAATVLAIGALGCCVVNETTPLWVLSAWQTVRACGVSSLIGPLQAWSLDKLEPRVITDGSSFSTIVRQAASSFGTSLMVAIISLTTAYALTIGNAALPYQCAFGFSALLSCAVLVFSICKVR